MLIPKYVFSYYAKSMDGNKIETFYDSLPCFETNMLLEVWVCERPFIKLQFFQFHEFWYLYKICKQDKLWINRLSRKCRSTENFVRKNIKHDKLEIPYLLNIEVKLLISKHFCRAFVKVKNSNNPFAHTAFWFSLLPSYGTSSPPLRLSIMVYSSLRRMIFSFLRRINRWRWQTSCFTKKLMSFIVDNCTRIEQIGKS